MPRYVVSISELSILPGNMPLYENIGIAFRQALLNALGTWLSPSPRVVRRADITSARGFETVATNVIDLPDSSLAERIDMLAQNLEGYLDAGDTGVTPNWGAVFIRPFNESLNGPPTFWSSGDAANTATRSYARWRPDQRVLLPDENPYGPDAAARRDPTPAESAEELAKKVRQQVSSNLSTLFWWGLGIGGVYLAVTEGPAIVRAISARPRKNPSKRRGRRAHVDQVLDVSHADMMALGLLLPP